MPKQEIIASLTTYGSRIGTVDIAIETILNQTLKADKVVLWLAEDEFNLDNIPDTLKKLQDKGLQIGFCDDIKSYKKLIPAIKQYPNDLIITFDDDIIYKDDIIEKLVSSYKNEPDVIHCMRGHEMKFNENKEIDSYSRWEQCSNNFNAGFEIFPTGSGGVLYPPYCFDPDVFNKDLFLELAPHGDDIWFKAMSLKKGVKCKIVEQLNNEYTDLEYIEGTQENALWLRNQDEENGNNPQIKAVFEKYGIYMKDATSWFDSSVYWDERYKKGGNSGAGSYNHLAQFKAEIINTFVAGNGVESVLEFGCGDGNNLSLYDIEQYTGIDVSTEAIEICKRKFGDDRSKKFLTTLEFDVADRDLKKADMTMSLDVIYHLIEEGVFHQYMDRLFESAGKFVIIYASNKDEPLCLHVKHRKFTDWIEKNRKDWKLKEFIPNKYPYDESRPQDTTFADFYIFEKRSELL